ncbi:MAG: RNA polymerase sigma factor [Planctomycetia bacterium]|nr:RNA polymerase sigma factor [Planctomycetia bacterium]
MPQREKKPNRTDFVQTDLYDSIRRFIFRRVRESDLADDLTQESWLRLSDQDPPITQEKVRGWLYRTARNLIVDTFRQREKRRDHQEILRASLESRIKDQPSDLLHKVESKEENQMVLDSIQELDQLHQEVLRLKFQEDLSYQEIADIIQKPKTTVAWILHESIVLLRTKFGSRQ